MQTASSTPAARSPGRAAASPGSGTPARPAYRRNINGTASSAIATAVRMTAATPGLRLASRAAGRPHPSGHRIFQPARAAPKSNAGQHRQREGDDHPESTGRVQQVERRNAGIQHADTALRQVQATPRTPVRRGLRTGSRLHAGGRAPAIRPAHLPRPPPRQRSLETARRSSAG